MNKSFTLPVEIKAVGDDGTFSGYAATFGNIDKGDDIIVKGAFADYLMSIGSNLPAVCWQHETDKPIGTTTLMREDEIGLYVEGKLILEVQQSNKSFFVVCVIETLIMIFISIIQFFFIKRYLIKVMTKKD